MKEIPSIFPCHDDVMLYETPFKRLKIAKCCSLSDIDQISDYRRRQKCLVKKSFLNQTTYVLKNRLLQQSFLKQDSFLNRAFLNRNSTVLWFT